MFRSKELKDFGERSGKISRWWLESDLRRSWRSFSYKFFKRPIFEIKLLYGWYVNVFRNDYDFDGHCLYAIVEYKLRRVEKALQNGFAIQEDMDMKALRLAVKLARRLKEDRYDDIFLDRHERKWGELETWLTPIPNTNSSQWHSRRSKAINAEQKEQERAEFIACMRAADAMVRREQKWFYGILNKYLRNWWD